MPQFDATQILLALAACTAAGLACHVLAMRLLTWRGITVRRTRFGLALLFDTTDADGTAVRMLNVGGAFQSVSYVEAALSCELACEYQREQARIVSELPRLRHAVVIGGGGFSFPKWLVAHLTPVRVTTVEIDPAIIELARASFGVAAVEAHFAPSGRFEIVCEDGWEWLRTQGERVDLLVNEAFSGKHPLGPLACTEGAKLIREHLSEGGAYLATLRFPLEGRRSAALYETLDTFAQEFAHVWLVPEFAAEPKRPGCNTLVCSNLDLAAAGCAPLVGHEWHPAEPVGR